MPIPFWHYRIAHSIGVGLDSCFNLIRVEVQIDQESWVAAVIDRSEEAEHAWKIWSLDWANPSPGEHTLTSRAIDVAGQIQPAMDDPLIAKKHTYWESNGQVTRRVLIA